MLLSTNLATIVKMYHVPQLIQIVLYSLNLSRSRVTRSEKGFLGKDRDKEVGERVERRQRNESVEDDGDDANNDTVQN